MAYYPQIAELRYKDRDIDTVIPIRIKLINIEMYQCKKCRKTGSETNWTRHIEHTKKSIKYDWLENHHMPEEIINLKTKRICPDCGNKIKIIKKPMYKIYASKSNIFINMNLMLNFCTGLRFKQTYTQFVSSSAYTCTIDDAYQGLDWFNKTKKLSGHPDSARYKKAKIKIIEGITEKQLKKENRNYEKRKTKRKVIKRLKNEKK